MSDSSRKERIRQYKERKRVGGVYVIKNTQNGKMLINSAADLRTAENRFEFARTTGSCIDLKLRPDWDRQNGSGFVFEVLEESEKGESQTEAEFRADIELLKEMWIEKLSGESLC